MNKIIILDWGIFLHRSIFALKNNPSIPATYTALSMIMGNLKRIGVDETDTIIVAVDGRGSWRKQYEGEYKADRKKKRDDSGLNFPHWFQKFDELLEDLEISTPWHTIKINHLEADDIMAVSARHFPSDKEIVLVTYDSDLEQMWEYPNVKIFSPKSKKYKVKPPKFNVYTFIAKKVNKEASDNLTSPILNEADYDNRMICVNLLTLPEWVESAVKDQLNNIAPRGYYPEQFPFASLKSRYMTLYTDKSKVLTYEQQVEKEEMKKLKLEKRKINVKEKEERKKIREAKKAEREARKAFVIEGGKKKLKEAKDGA